VDFFWRGLFLILFGPLIFAVALHMILAAFIVMLPWLLLFAVVIGVTAGIAAALILSWRFGSRTQRSFPPRNDAYLPSEDLPPDPAPVRRPRGARRREED
jgi:hypothetical protein